MQHVRARPRRPRGARCAAPAQPHGVRRWHCAAAWVERAGKPQRCTRASSPTLAACRTGGARPRSVAATSQESAAGASQPASEVDEEARARACTHVAIRSEAPPCSSTAQLQLQLRTVAGDARRRGSFPPSRALPPRFALRPRRPAGAVPHQRGEARHRRPVLKAQDDGQRGPPPPPPPPLPLRLPQEKTPPAPAPLRRPPRCASSWRSRTRR